MCIVWRWVLVWHHCSQWWNWFLVLVHARQVVVKPDWRAIEWANISTHCRHCVHTSTHEQQFFSIAGYYQQQSQQRIADSGMHRCVSISRGPRKRWFQNDVEALSTLTYVWLRTHRCFVAFILSSTGTILKRASLFPAKFGLLVCLAVLHVLRLVFVARLGNKFEMTLAIMRDWPLHAYRVL